MIGTPCLSTRAFGLSQTNSHSILLDKTPAVKHMHTVRRNPGPSTQFIGLRFRLRSTDPARSLQPMPHKPQWAARPRFRRAEASKDLRLAGQRPFPHHCLSLSRVAKPGIMSAALHGPPLAELARRKLMAGDCPAAHKARELGVRERTPLSVGCEMDWVVNGSDDE